jgi:HAD superfamily hydrolase (TIGR01549 family)
LTLLLDLDDTLCDYTSARDLRLRTAFLLNGDGRPVARPEIDLDEMIAASLSLHPHGAEHFPELFADFGLDSRAAARAQEWYRANRFHGLRLFDDVWPVLSTLKSKPAAKQADGRSIGLITNGPTEVQRQKVDLLGIGDLVDFVVISEEFGVAKPDPAIFAEALRLATATADRALFVGDSPEFDIAGARASGIAPV